MALSKFADYLNSLGVVFYTKKTNNGTITDIKEYKSLACFKKEPNNKLVPGADTLVIFTGNTNKPNQYLNMIDFDKLDILQNKDFHDRFIQLLKELKIDTYHEQTMRNGYHYFFLSDILYKSTQNIECNGILVNVDIRGHGGKSISWGSKFDNMKVKPGINEACKKFKIAILPQGIIEFLKMIKYDSNASSSVHEIPKPRKVREIDSTDTKFSLIKPLIQDIGNEVLDSNITKAHAILALLSKQDEKYYSNYNEWLIFGFALGSLANEEPQLEDKYLELYLAFSAQYKYWNLDNYNMACNIFFSSNNTITLGTLVYNLKKYDEAFKRYRDLCTITKFEKMVNSPTHGSVSVYYHSLYPDKYIYDDNLNKWYILLESNIWELLRDHTRRIRIDLKNTITEIITCKLKNLEDSSANENHKNKGKIQKYMKILDKLNTEDFMKNTFNALKDCYYRIDIKFDESQNLFTFRNGICYDLSNSQKTIRKVKPDDYITLNTGYDYKEPNPDDINFIRNFIFSLFENDNDVSFMIKSISNVLYGNNKYQKCFFFLGIGANWKSVLLTLLERAFGNYAMKASSTLFTKPEKDALISPEIVQCRNKRFLHISEPNPDDKIQQGRYKSTTGNECISARALFSNEIETYVPSFIPFISCNQIPIFEKIDEAIKRRSILIKFIFRFTNKIECANDRPIDLSLHDKINNNKMGLALIHILFEYFEHEYDPANHLPDNSKNIINDFLSDNDPLHDFLNSDKVEINKDNNDYKIAISDLYQLYKDFIEADSADSGIKILPLRKFTNLISSKGFIKTRINYTYILGIRVKSTTINQQEGQRQKQNKIMNYSKIQTI